MWAQYWAHIQIIKTMVEMSYMHPLYTCNYILYITHIPMHVSIMSSMICMPNFYHIGSDKLVNSINLMFLLVCGASIETVVDWKRQKNFYGLAEMPQGHVVFSRIWSIFPFLENNSKVLEQTPWDNFLFVTCVACWCLLKVQVTLLEVIKLFPWRLDSIQFTKCLRWL